ncbi:L,D-transpeptidase family protein [Azospirillum halopraeferens]|uniref:L,D-transpeptidase family protein n=1 Tax=Azospirillum halopraeferens TaxID=34010 RepID=UPI000414AC87|nr:L,D-transpeptidase family protein [Azospirillum halopraeferens]
MSRFATLLLVLLLYPMGAGALPTPGESVAGPAAPGDATAITPPDAAVIDVPEPAVTGAPDMAMDTAIARRMIDESRFVAGRPVDLPGLRRFYARRGFAPLWLDAAGVPMTAAAGVLDAIRAADAEGLASADYHADTIAARLTDPERASRVELDLLLTDAVMRYGAHLRSGRVLPKTVASDIAVTPLTVDPAAVAEETAASADPRAHLAALAPARPDYALLKDALRRYRALEAKGGWPIVPSPRVTKLEPGMRDPAVKALRRRLAVTGEYTDPGRDKTAERSDLYDAPLKKAVERFQARHGLTVDGVIGPATLTALNVPAADRVGQILANLERMRWLPDGYGARHVAVNVPDYSLTAVDDGRTVLSMRVIVGTPARRTPILSSTITSVVFNPAWTVPVRLAREDYLPKLLKDPGYLAKNGFTLFSSWSADARPLDARRIDWKSVGRGIGAMRLRQDPGPNNALGQVKFNIPNAFDVYLHDTPGREKFDRSVRTFSSGCVRVGDPMALADFVMTGMTDWPADRRRQVLDKGETRTVALKPSVAVHLLYHTAWADADGTVQFREDIYGRDTDLLSAIARKAPPASQRVALGG